MKLKRNKKSLKEIKKRAKLKRNKEEILKKREVICSQSRPIFRLVKNISSLRCLAENYLIGKAIISNLTYYKYEIEIVFTYSSMNKNLRIKKKNVYVFPSLHLSRYSIKSTTYLMRIPC